MHMRVWACERQVRELHRHGVLPPMTEEELDATFRALDVNRDGSISPAEFNDAVDFWRRARDRHAAAV